MFCLKIFVRQIPETSIHIYVYIFVYMYTVLVLFATKKYIEKKQHILICKNNDNNYNSCPIITIQKRKKL